MPEKYTERVKAYCEATGIEIPAGFYLHAASRYVAIDVGGTPPKLIAKTWFNQEDVVYYLKNLALGKKIRVLDFKERQELSFQNGERLARGTEF